MGRLWAGQMPFGAKVKPPKGKPQALRYVTTFAIGPIPAMMQHPAGQTPPILPPDAAGVARAAEILRAGGIVAMPTETVYGLAGDARSDRACGAIFTAKGRPQFNPLIVHVADLAQARTLAQFDATAEALAHAFWPGPLTLVLPLCAGHGLSPLVSAGQKTVALRLPAHAVARDVISTFGGPIAAPSANRSGRVSPTRANHVAASLGAKVDAILDGGAAAVGVESTILLLQDGRATLLREGGISREALAPYLGDLSADLTPDQITAPGQMASHYAPETPMRLRAVLDDPTRLRIAFGPKGAADFTLSETGDLTEAAARLFDLLHHADRAARDLGKIGIDIMPVPDHGIGRAINDRLRRACAPRSTD